LTRTVLPPPRALTLYDPHPNQGAEDYVDAATRVTKLRLQRGQQADAARVLLECCGQEGVFNLFYALLGARLCGCHRELKFGLQCAYWDEFKQLEGASLHRAANLAKLLAQLLGRAALPLAALRVVPWGSLEPRAVFFWQVCFTELLQLEPAMMRAAMAQLQEPAFAELRDGVMLFIGRHLRPLVLKKTPALSEALAELVALTIPVD
jgi:nucleolar MIF4G domain-containing protein 1